jgi:hypothetical protein
MARKLTAFYIDPEQADALRAIRKRDGIVVGEQIRRAIDLWLRQKAIVKATSRRVLSRRKV